MFSDSLRTWAEVDLSAITHNFMAAKSKLPKEMKMLATVKANAYGHDAVTVTKLLEGKADYFALAAMDEAVQLRQAGIRTQIHAEQKKFKQKISYADKLAIPYAIFLGEDEIAQAAVSIKDMTSGNQQTMPVAEAVSGIKAAIEARADVAPIKG